MSDRFSIVTLCTGNVHRSALAATLLRQWARWYLPPELAESVCVGSAGFAAPVGTPMGDRVLAIVSALGADGSTHRAAQVEDTLLAEADLVLVASRRQLDKVLSQVPSAVRRTFTIREAGRIAEGFEAPSPPTSLQDLRRLVERLADSRAMADIEGADDIIDPQGRGDEAYLQMVREEVDPLARLGALLFGMPHPDLAAYLTAAEDPAALLNPSAVRGRTD
ncbi:arsenate reductase/protein-tyrosine-phosphatase family protein [Microbacterium sp. P5_E9]